MYINSSPTVIGAYTSKSQPNTESEVITNSNSDNSKESSKPNFSNMTQSELFDWTNEKAKSGELTPKEVWSFAYMALDIPVDKELSTDDLKPDDSKRINFLDKVWDGILGASQNDDPETKQRLESVLNIMKREQGNAIDVSA